MTKRKTSDWMMKAIVFDTVGALEAAGVPHALVEAGRVRGQAGIALINVIGDRWQAMVLAALDGNRTTFARALEWMLKRWSPGMDDTTGSFLDQDGKRRTIVLGSLQAPATAYGPIRGGAA